MKIASNRDLNKDQKKLTPQGPGDVKHDASDKQPVKEHPMAQDDNSRMLSKKHNDEKLAITFLIVGAGLIAYHLK